MSETSSNAAPQRTDQCASTMLETAGDSTPNRHNHLDLPELSSPDRQDLSDVSIVIAVSCGDSSPIVGFTKVLDYIEEHFNAYEIVIVEIGSRKFKNLPERKNVHYRWLQHGHSIEDAVSCGIKTASREEKNIHVIDGTIGSADILRHYADLHECHIAKQAMVQHAVGQVVGQP